MDGNQEIMYISRSETQCPNCYGELDSKEKKRGTFFCLYCGQKLVVGNDPARPAAPAQPVAQQGQYRQQGQYGQPANPAQQRMPAGGANGQQGYGQSAMPIPPVVVPVTSASSSQPATPVHPTQQNASQSAYEETTASAPKTAYAQPAPPRQNDPYGQPGESAKEAPTGGFGTDNYSDIKDPTPARAGTSAFGESSNSGGYSSGFAAEENYGGSGSYSSGGSTNYGGAGSYSDNGSTYYGSTPEPKKTQPVRTEKKTSVYGILSVVFGAVSALTCCCYGSGILFGAVSIVCGVLGIKKNKSRNLDPGALNIIGLILGILGTVVSLIMTIWIIIASVTGGSTPMNTIQNTTGTQTTWGAGTPSDVKENSTGGGQAKEEKKSETAKQDTKTEEPKFEAKTQEPKEESKSEEAKAEETKSEEPKAEEAKSEEKAEEKADSGEISKEFKDYMDSYEACIDEYVSLMKKMQSDPTNMELMSAYLDYIDKIEKMEEKMDAWKGTMNDAEEAYYTKVMLRCSEKMMNAAYN